MAHGHPQSHGSGGVERLNQCREPVPAQRGKRVRPHQAFKQRQLMASRFHIHWVLVDELAIGLEPWETRQPDRFKGARCTSRP